MLVPAKELRREPGKILAYVRRGHTVTVTYRGQVCANIVPAEKSGENLAHVANAENSLFGIWSDRNDLPDPNDYVESLRKGRFDVR